MTEQINSGLLVMGVSSTVLFDGETSTTELILLNLATGDDFSLPISEEQASFLFGQLASEDEPPSNGVSAPSEDIADIAQAAAFAEKIGLGDSSGEGNSPGDVEETPQF